MVNPVSIYNAYRTAKSVAGAFKKDKEPKQQNAVSYLSGAKPNANRTYSVPTQQPLIGGNAIPLAKTVAKQQLGANTNTGSVYSRPSSFGTSAAQTAANLNTAAKTSTAAAQGATNSIYSNYLAKEAALRDSGQNNLAMQGSLDFIGGNKTGGQMPSVDMRNGETTPGWNTLENKFSTNPNPTPASAGAAAANRTNLASIAEQNLAKLQQQYLASLTPTEREQQLQRELTDLRGNNALGVAGLAGQGRGIPDQIIRGQQGILKEQGQLEAQTLEAQIANELAARQAQGTVYGAQLGFEDKRLEREAAAELARQKGYEPQQVGNDLVALNPATGQYEVVYRGPVGGDEGFSLSPGQIRYDSNGNVIATGAPQSSSSDGFSLSPGQVRYDANGNVIAASPGGGAANATESERSDAGFYNRATAAEKNIQAAIEKGITNIRLNQNLPNELQGEQFKLFRQAGEDFIKAVLRAESGASIPPDEMNSYFKTYFPQPGDPQSVIDQKAASRQEQIKALEIGAGRALDTGQDDPLGLGFSGVGGDTNKAANVTTAIRKAYPPDSKGGQCGRFVNNLTGIGMGNSFDNKMSFTNPSIKVPQPGDVFVMPYSWTGHTGIVSGNPIPKADGTFDIPVVDSNYRLNEKVQYHTINSSKIAGYARVPLKSKYLT